jgi:hypothetical protein
MAPGFQFSLGKMLRATAWFAVICVAVTGKYEIRVMRYLGHFGDGLCSSPMR